MPGPGATPPTRTARKRLWTGRILLTIGLLITGVWAASRWLELSYASDKFNAAIVGGCYSAETIKSWNVWHPKHSPQWSLAPNTFSDWQWLIAPGRFLNARNVVSSTNFRVLAITELDYSAKDGPVVREFTFVLWPLAIPPLAAAAWFLLSAHRSRRWISLGLCPACGYNLASINRRGPCPECGTVPAAISQTQRRRWDW